MIILERSETLTAEELSESLYIALDKLKIPGFRQHPIEVIQGTKADIVAAFQYFGFQNGVVLYFSSPDKIGHHHERARRFQERLEKLCSNFENPPNGYIDFMLDIKHSISMANTTFPEARKIMAYTAALLLADSPKIFNASVITKTQEGENTGHTLSRITYDKY